METSAIEMNADASSKMTTAPAAGGDIRADRDRDPATTTTIMDAAIIRAPGAQTNGAAIATITMIETKTIIAVANLAGVAPTETTMMTMVVVGMATRAAIPRRLGAVGMRGAVKATATTTAVRAAAAIATTTAEVVRDVARAGGSATRKAIQKRPDAAGETQTMETAAGLVTRRDTPRPPVVAGAIPTTEIAAGMATLRDIRKLRVEAGTSGDRLPGLTTTTGGGRLGAAMIEHR